mmetsp:Transcript_6014/g.20532  ORF Transcript_6014/g.20532 Transcript_6014/m.20532 type:complete len:227 (-) Transcript_6014:1755-2435(-)
MGGRLHAFFSLVVGTRSTSALRPNSCCPGTRFIFHTRQLVAASYLALPLDTWMRALAVHLGTGTRITTPRANSLALKSDLNRTLASMRVRPSSLSMGSTRKGRLTPSVMRYFMSSNSPSGGTNDTSLLLSKRLRFTHWWKVTSSSSMLLLPPPRDDPAPPPDCALRDAVSRSMPSLSLSPSLRSGIPLRKHFIWIFPLTSARSCIPPALMSRLTFSMMSRYTSFFL